MKEHRRFPGRPSALIGVVSVLALLQSCARAPTPISEPLRINKRAEAAGSIALTPEQQVNRRDTLAAQAGPEIPLGRAGAEPILSSTPPRLTGESISINFDGIRLPAFINTVFGELLKVTFEIDSTVAQRDQMVTLRTAEPLAPNAFFELVTATLANYGISVVYSNNIYRIVEATAVRKPIPRVIRARTAANVPNDLRPLFYFQPLDSVPANVMVSWLGLIMGDRIEINPLTSANGLVLLGPEEDVRMSAEIVEALDQPYYAGRRSLKISPAFWSAQKLAQQLTDILSAEGYSIGIGSTNQSAIKLIPVDALNVIVAFGTGDAELQHLLQWAAELDQPSQTVSSQGAFYHQIYNAKAADLAGIIQGLTGTASSGSASRSEQRAAADGATESNTQVNILGGGRQRIMVDESRNALIFVGTAEEYAQFRTLVQQMDRAPLEVMIEATIAEVTLSENESLGVVLDYDNGRAAAPNRTVVRSDDGGIFFNLIRDRASIISRINALADYSRVQVLSSPRLVTSSGKSAAISVGTQVPLITTQETGPGTVGGNTSILQSIQYRSTGIILNIEPTINSSRRVELTVSGEVSAAQANDLSGVQSPLILNRSLQTTLSLNDGETALLGGMISENHSTGNSGVPYLKDIPILGNLFKSGSRSVDRTELIVLITPYIIDGPDTAGQVRDAFRRQLGEWAEPPSSPATRSSDPGDAVRQR